MTRWISRYFTLFFLSLTACGGGTNSIPDAPPKDVEPPYVLDTIPKSEKSNVSTTNYIYVTFNEPVVNVTTDQISIFPYLDGKIDEFNPIVLNNNSFNFDNKTNKLEVKLGVNDLIPGTKYQIRVENITDTSGNVLQNSCVWEFTTIGAPSITAGYTGLCGVLERPPSKLNRVVAISGAQKISLFWDKPPYGTSDNFKIYVSSDKRTNYIPVRLDLAGNIFSYIDRNVQNNTVYTYKVIASNAIDESAPAYSNLVTPTVGFISLTPSSEIFSNNPSLADDFGFAIAISPDGKTLAIGEPNGNQNSAFNASNPGNVQLFIKTGSTWKPGIVLLAKTPQTGNRFGVSLAFSPDGTTLAVGEDYGDFADATDAGAVHLFYKTGNDWTTSPIRGQKLKSQIFTASNRFGVSLAFSPDSSTLAVGEVLGDPTTSADAGTVQLFIKIGTSWKNDILLTAQTPIAGNNFGVSLIFSPDGSALAIGEASTTANTGAVHLFTKFNSKWKHSQVLHAKTPEIANGFGISVAFSPDSSTLAVGEYLGDLNKVVDSGSVQLFIKSGLAWDKVPIVGAVLSSQIPGTQNRFGKSLAFSPDGITLSVGEILGGNISNVAKSGTVQHFLKADAKWLQVPNRGPVLRPTTTTNASYFGYTIVFSPDGSILIVGELYGLQDKGQVSIFDTSQPSL